MARVGVCEDDPTVRRLLARALGGAGHTVTLAHTGGEALALFGPDTPLDVVVMDVGLPDSDGRDVCQALQAAGQRAPVLFLTAYGEVHERLAGFAAGGDDYVVKPFEVKELVARVEALARRGAGTPAGDVGGLVLDPVTHAVRTSHGEAALTPTEFRVLAAITSRPGEVVRRRAVVAAGWPDGAQVSDNTLDSFLRRLRRKLESVQADVTIETVRGVGYRVR
jgi:two-component system response regulator MprA